MTTDYGVSRESLLLWAPLERLHVAHTRLWKRDACGVTRSGRQIPALVHPDVYDIDSGRFRVLIIGGLCGLAEDAGLTFKAIEQYASRDVSIKKIALSIIPCANPDGLALGIGPDNGADGNPNAGYPPANGFFNDPRDPEARYLWHWICYQAPDLVVELRTGGSPYWEANYAAGSLVRDFDAAILVPAGSLLYALGEGTPAGLEPVPGLRLTAAAHLADHELEKLWRVVMERPDLRQSPAAEMLGHRRSRSPMELARVLADTYGHKLEEIIYTQGVALSGRMRLHELDPEYPDPTAEICSLVEPYVNGERHPFDGRSELPNLAGVVWAEDLYNATGDTRCRDLLTTAADRAVGLLRVRDVGGSDFRVEDVFFDGAVLGRAYGVTEDARFLDALSADLAIACGQQQPGGLFWHARQAPFFWGRGNGFVALGMAEALRYLPEDHPTRPRVLEVHRRHLDAISRTQCPSGMLRQVLDFPGSYEEHSATCMFGYALAVGIRKGWLDRVTFEPVLARAWRAAAERIDAKGRLLDVCAGTGLQADLRAYLDRPAVSGFDDRGGSMALWFATEMARLYTVLAR